MVEFLGTYEWAIERDWFGGFSGIELSDDGLAMTVISDAGYLLRGSLERDTNGRIVAIDATPPTRLFPVAKEAELDGFTRDSEGLAIGPKNELHVSFERFPRIWTFETPGRPPQRHPRLAAFAELRQNGSFEALAIDAQGRLLTMPEVAPDPSQGFPVYLLDRGRWSQPFFIPKRGKFRPVGADFGPDGLLYLLERSYSLLGFRSRVRRFSFSETVLESEDTLLETKNRAHDNLEGIAIWTETGGGLRMTLISDDNFNWIQKTELVDYAIH